MDKFKDLIEKIEGMSVIELHELVKTLEERFGVSAAAVAVAARACVFFVFSGRRFAAGRRRV